MNEDEHFYAKEKSIFIFAFISCLVWDNFDYRSKEILYFASQAIDYATVDKMVW